MLAPFLFTLYTADSQDSGYHHIQEDTEDTPITAPIWTGSPPLDCDTPSSHLSQVGKQPQPVG